MYAIITFCVLGVLVPNSACIWSGNKENKVCLMKLKRFLNILFTASLLLVFSGCGKKPPPPPPKSRSELVLEVLDAVKHKNHTLALRKISRLRELEPTNVFLANLEILEQNNIIIVLAQKEINKKDLKSALGKINEGIKKPGRHDDLMTTQKKLAVADRIKEILEIFKHPKDSSQLMQAAVQLKTIGSKYKPAAPFVPIAELKIAEAKKMNEWETQRALESFCTYIDEMLIENDPDVNLLFAVLEVTDPLNHVLLNYLDYLQGNEDVSLMTYEDVDVFSSDDDNIMSDLDSTEDKIKSEKGEQAEENKQEKKEWWNKFKF